MFRLVFALLRSKVIEELFCEGLVGFRKELPKAERGRGMLVRLPKRINKMSAKVKIFTGKTRPVADSDAACECSVSAKKVILCKELESVFPTREKLAPQYLLLQCS
jgi:hypothetical protein